MKVVGFVVEYNLFYNGYCYYLVQVKCLIGVDVVVVVMLGNFIQCGELIILDKWFWILVVL